MLSTNKKTVAVIGTGNIGKHHIRIYSEIPNVQLVGIADINEKIGSSLTKKYRTKFYTSSKELLEKEVPNIASICVPTSLHYDVAKVFIEKRINILLEKPIATDLVEAKKLLTLARKNNVQILIGHVERFNPAVKKVKEMIDKGELGKIIAIMARRVGGFPPQIKDANISVDLAIHDIDVANYLLGEQPKEVYVNKQKNHIKNREDSVEFFLKYRRASVYIQANWISPVKIRKLNITGTEGYLEMDYITQKIEYYKSNYSKFKEATKDFSDYILRFSIPDRINISVAKKEPLKEEIQYFLSMIENNQRIDSQFAVNALKIAQNSNF